MNSLSKESRTVYKGTLGRFLEALGSKDLATVTPDEVLKFTSKQAEISHIKSILMYIARNNLNDGLNKMSKQTLVWFIQSKID